MKLCHITTIHPRYDIRIFHKECISLSKHGNDVTLVVNDELQDEEISGVKIISIRRPYKNRLHRFIFNSSKKKILKVSKTVHADIYHFHDPELLSVGVKLKKLGFKVIYDSHEDVPRQIYAKEWIPKFLRTFLSSVFESYENKCSKLFDAIIVPTPHLKERFSMINSSVFEVCNFPSLEDIKFSGQNYSNLNEGIYIGDLTITRGIKQIAEACEKSNLILKLCGKFHSNGLKEDLDGKYDNIRYLGFLDRNRIAEELSKSSLGFVTLLNTPNDALSYPIKMFEYMAAGIPVIASNFPLYKNIIEEYNCGICVDPLNVDDIARAIYLITSNAFKANELRLNGYNAIKNIYNWESQEMKLIDCYNMIQRGSEK